ncbi:MAG TPA: type IV secretion system DNA-binding domain-containing protein [Steroidobacteraceae bacterium]|jgi:type IV secretory pathway VirB4 component|nr:type IV secretion system DNA-binding domain-containing protein [Steroidobacteraceae bacterium]
MAERIPFTSHVAPNVVRTAFGDYVQVFKLQGASFETADAEQLNNWHERLNVLWRNIGTPHVAAWTHVVRRRAGLPRSARQEDLPGENGGFADSLRAKYMRRLELETLMIAQVSSIYGQGEAQTLVENCSTTLILRCSGSENGGTSQFASRLIGDREVARKQVTRGSDRGAQLFSRGNRSSRSVCDQFVTEAAVLPSELEQLPDLCGYLKGASSPRWLKVIFRGPRDAARSTHPMRRFIAP